MAHFYSWPKGDGLVLYGLRLLVGAAMVAEIWLGLNAIRQRRFADHGAWMLRAYALGMGAGTQGAPLGGCYLEHGMEPLKNRILPGLAR